MQSRPWPYFCPFTCLSRVARAVRMLEGRRAQAEVVRLEIVPIDGDLKHADAEERLHGGRHNAMRLRVVHLQGRVAVVAQGIETVHLARARRDSRNVRHTLCARVGSGACTDPPQPYPLAS